jgi:uncharacterized protein Smg (DUF494 family)
MAGLPHDSPSPEGGPFRRIYARVVAPNEDESGYLLEIEQGTSVTCSEGELVVQKRTKISVDIRKSREIGLIVLVILLALPADIKSSVISLLHTLLPG